MSGKEVEKGWRMGLVAACLKNDWVSYRNVVHGKSEMRGWKWWILGALLSHWPRR